MCAHKQTLKCGGLPHFLVDYASTGSSLSHSRGLLPPVFQQVQEVRNCAAKTWLSETLAWIFYVLYNMLIKYDSLLPPCYAFHFMAKGTHF